MGIFKCFKSDFEDLQKKINRITKKLDKNNLKWTFKTISESIEEVTMYDYTNYDNIPSSQFVPKNCGKIAVDVVTYNFEMESLKLGEYTVVAVLEHNTIDGQTENIIHIVVENEVIDTKYRIAKSICEHCNSNRERNKTVLLKDNNNNIKQVGTTCIKEYTGIDGIDIIRAYADIHDIIIDNNRLYADYETFGYRKSKYKNTLEYLTNCIQLITEIGYKKDETKTEAWEIKEINEKYKATAIKVIEYFKTNDFSDNFLNNIKIYLSSEYTKISGFVAYAYMAYMKEIEKEHIIKTESHYVGSVGDKIQTELIFKNHHSYETSYNGYNTTIQHIFIFEDKDGNEYKWNTANTPLFDDKTGEWKQFGEIIKIKGSIKAHEEYKDKKQTVLTRCKIIE